MWHVQESSTIPAFKKLNIAQARSRAPHPPSTRNALPQAIGDLLPNNTRRPEASLSQTSKEKKATGAAHGHVPLVRQQRPRPAAQPVQPAAPLWRPPTHASPDPAVQPSLRDDGLPGPPSGPPRTPLRSSPGPRVAQPASFCPNRPPFMVTFVKGRNIPNFPPHESGAVWERD